MTRPNPILWQFHHEFRDWKRAGQTIASITLWGAFLILIGFVFLVVME